MKAGSSFVCTGCEHLFQGPFAFSDEQERPYCSRQCRQESKFIREAVEVAIADGEAETTFVKRCAAAFAAEMGRRTEATARELYGGGERGWQPKRSSESGGT
jgi:hypothetical protein